MKVCFSVGPMSSRLINSMSNSVDNVEFFSYDSIKDMIKESTMRHIFFDRIILSEKLVENPDDEFSILNNYISEYSDNTSIVLIYQGEGSAITDSFLRIFNSPLYTPVTASPLTVNILNEFVKSDIPSLKIKYFREDGKKVKSVTSKYKGETKKEEKPEKKGFFDKLFGRKKNSMSKTEIEENISDDVKSEGNTEDSVSKNSTDQELGSTLNQVGNTDENTGIGYFGENDGDSNSDFPDSILGSAEYETFNDQIMGENSESGLEDLGIGYYGENHTDTGYLDDDAESELEDALKELKDNSDSVVEDLDTDDSDESISGTVIVSGIRGTGVTSYIVDSSIKLANQGKRVLIIDCDYSQNGVLSFIDTAEFYKERYNRGISNIKVYSEDGVFLVSNGYGCGISDADRSNIFALTVGGEFDVIFIDCPIDCIDSLNKSIINNSRVMIRVEGNRGSMISTILGVTNVDSALEDCLFNNSDMLVINKISEYASDLSFLIENTLFSRGSWLSKFS